MTRNLYTAAAFQQEK